MGKKLRLFVAIFACVACISGCGASGQTVKQDENDSARFKNEYESVNGKVDHGGELARELSIDENNPIVYSSYLEIDKKMSNNETFAVYFGFASCPWCRASINSIIKSAKENNIEKLYYVDVESSRDQYKCFFGKPIRISKGADGYDKILSDFSDVLSDYIITDSADNEVDTGEKRVYAPNVVVVKAGVPQALVETSELLENPYMELTEDIQRDMCSIYGEAFLKLD